MVSLHICTCRTVSFFPDLIFHCVPIDGYLDNCPYLSITNNTAVNIRVTNFLAQSSEREQGVFLELAGKSEDVCMCFRSDGHC